jgi:hypothetical protein
LSLYGHAIREPLLVVVTGTNEKKVNEIERGCDGKDEK